MFRDRVRDTSTTTGTGNITLSGTAPTGFESFNTAFGVGTAPNNLFFYVIWLQSGAEWEVGRGHLSGSTTLVRDQVYQSSNSDAPVSFSAGTKDVFNDLPALAAQRVFNVANIAAVHILR